MAQFGIEEHGRVSYLYKAVGDQGVETASSAGTQQDLHSTSLGKAILAHLPEEEVESIIENNGLPPKTENTITDQDELMAELKETRERRYAIDDEENISGLRCIAAPVMNDDAVFAAVSVSGPSSRLSGETLTEDLPATVMRTANVIEFNTKFSN